MSNIEDGRTAAPEKLDAERGVPPVNGRKSGNKIGKFAGLAALVAIVGVMVWLNVKPKSAPVVKEKPVAETRRSLPALELDDDPPPPPPPATPPTALAQQPGQPAPPAAGPAQPQGPTPEELLLARRQRAPIIAFGGKGNGDAQALAGKQDDAEEPGELGSVLKATKTDAVSASMLIDRNYLIAKGTFLDCALITAITSTLPGMTSCRLTRNVYSDNGKVLLLERGSIVEGEYRSGQMKQGMDRIFVLWTRVRTPKGVAIQLDSPGADELGRSGMVGWVDTHFWKRYGGALLLSLVDAGTEYAIAQQKAKSECTGARL